MWNFPLFSLLTQHRGISGSTASLLTLTVGVASCSVDSSVGAASSVDTSAGANSLVSSSVSCGVGGLLILLPGYPLAPQ